MRKNFVYSEIFFGLPYAKILWRKTDHCLCVQLICFWNFTRKIPNSGIGTKFKLFESVKEAEEKSFFAAAASPAE